MLGNRVIIRRKDANDVKGVLQKQDATGVVVTVDAWAERARNLFVPMTAIIEIEDQGPVYR